MNNTKTVSVVMCTYNGERYLKEQIDSILSQTYPIQEFIIQDDNSNDSTVSIIKQYASTNPIISFYINETNIGFNMNFKSAVMKAKADYIAISDQDDVWMKDKIENQIETIGCYNICFSTHLRGSSMENTHIVSSQYSLEALLFGGLAGHTMLLRRDFIQRDESWIEKIFYDKSLAVNAYFYRDESIIKIDKPLNWHRSHEKETALLQNRRIYPEQKRIPTYEPYFFGLKYYRNLQNKESWKKFYSFVYEKTKDNEKLRLQHTMSGLMLNKNLPSLIRLGFICMKHRRTIYPNIHKTKGIMGVVRGFFYPLISSYRCSEFDL